MLGDTGRVTVEQGSAVGTGVGWGEWVGSLVDKGGDSNIPSSADPSKQRRRSALRQECRV